MGGAPDEAICEWEEQCLSAHVDRTARISKRARNRESARNVSYSSSNLHNMMEGDSLSVQELGMLFISILMAAYVSQIEHGELEDAHILAVTIH
jgi:hypothetical protein